MAEMERRKWMKAKSDGYGFFKGSKLGIHRLYSLQNPLRTNGSTRIRLLDSSRAIQAIKAYMSGPSNADTSFPTPMPNEHRGLNNVSALHISHTIITKTELRSPALPMTARAMWRIKNHMYITVMARLQTGGVPLMTHIAVSQILLVGPEAGLNVMVGRHRRSRTEYLSGKSWLRMNVKLFGYPIDADEDCESPLELKDVTLCASAETFREMAKFLIWTAQQMDDHGDDFGHEHFEDYTNRSISPARSLVVTRLK